MNSKFAGCLPAAGAAVLAASLAATPAGAAVTDYTSQAAFASAVGGVTTFGFTGSGPAPVASNPYTKGPITFTDNVTAADVANGGTPIQFLIDKAYTPNYGVDFLSFQNTDVGISADVTTSGYRAVGFDFGTHVAPGAATLTVDGTAFAISPSTTAAFIGFTSPTPITDISIEFPTGYSFDLTSVSFGGATGVPEPTAWALMIAGVAGMGGVLRRRRGRGAAIA